MRPSWLLVATLLFAPVVTLVAQANAADSSWFALVHQLTYGLRGAGHRADETYYVDDSLELGLLRSASMPVSMTHFPRHLPCPSTGLTPATTVDVGYGTSIDITIGADSADRTIKISVSCTYVRSNGRDFGFMESGTWALHRTGNVWSVVKQLSAWIT